MALGRRLKCLGNFGIRYTPGQRILTADIIKHMKNTIIKNLAIYITLVTVSAVLILLGIFWLSMLACALVSLAELFSCRRNTHGGGSFIPFALAALLILALDWSGGYALKQDRRPLLYLIVVAIGWLWACIVALVPAFILVLIYRYRIRDVDHAA
jgi:hypothetical protein